MHHMAFHACRHALGLDIGGANVKGAHSDGHARTLPFELWKRPAQLSEKLRSVLDGLPTADLLTATMTGELCDCFATKRAGVHFILDAVDAVRGNRQARIWHSEGRLVTLDEARANPLGVAAANWLAVATFAARRLDDQSGLVIDIGSTTTDIVPFSVGRAVPMGRTDATRLRCQELIYTGVRRTPVCALLGLEVTAELFATTHDAYLILGRVAEDETDCLTADGRPATRTGARARLARMVGADAETCSDAEVYALANRVEEVQVEAIRRGIFEVAQHLRQPPQAAVLAGSGEFLARRVLASVPDLARLRIWSLATELGPELSQVACAYALAQLARGLLE
jgi:probable H4MPT-linked C1 transfer pathway protein